MTSKKYFYSFLSIVLAAIIIAFISLHQSATAPAELALSGFSVPETQTASVDTPLERVAPSAPTAQPIQSSTSTAASAPEEHSNASLTVQGTTYPIAVIDGESVIEAMRQLVSDTAFTFSGHEYPSLGFFVEEINGRKNADGYYWFLYLNGRSSDAGASQTKLSPGDAVEWKYEKAH